MTNPKHLYLALAALAMAPLAGCSDSDDIPDPTPEVIDPTVSEQFYSGGKLGTSFISSSKAYEQPSPAVNDNGMFHAFNRGEKFFENPFTTNNNGGEREGLGPLYIRPSCIHCHPGYGHGKSQPDGAFNTRDVGNGYLLVVYDKTTNAYVQWLSGMPQGHAVAPFKAPVDESKVTIKWHEFQDEWGNKFADGETYSLRYPDVTLPREAVYVIGQGYEDASTNNYEVRLENTIGIYGSGLLDAIPDDSILAQYHKEFKDGYFKANGLNPAYFDNGTGQYTGWYKNGRQGDGTGFMRRFTYACSRGPLADGPGANALWNIFNVTRSDRRYNYLDMKGTIYAEKASKDPEVQAAFPAYISKITTAIEHPEWFTANVEKNIYDYLTSTKLDVEISDDDYINFMVWHRGLAVPAARNIADAEVQRGKKLFEQTGCAYCHRPSWTTGDDKVNDPNLFKVRDPKSPNYGKTLADLMPRYPKQKIWPYTDMVQHKLFMKNDIRTGWCRTTPLWGRALHQLCTSSAPARPTPTACTTAAPATWSKPSCGTAPTRAARAMPTMP